MSRTHPNSAKRQPSPKSCPLTFIHAHSEHGQKTGWPQQALKQEDTQRKDLKERETRVDTEEGNDGFTEDP